MKVDVDRAFDEHIPVLEKELAERICLPRDGVMVDATVGQGGHSYLFGSSLGPEGVLIGLDFDEKSIQRAHLKLKDLTCKVILVHSNFSQIAEVVKNCGFEKVDFILADLGVCSSQLVDEQIGLSFQTNMPLDMRLDKRIKATAADIVNNEDEETIADLIYTYGEERASRRIARLIVEYRKSQLISTTSQLAAIVTKAVKGRSKGSWTKIHPATRTFQALRIAVNDELGNLERILDSAPDLLKEDGQIAMISFHSLEDRIVKYNFKENEKSGKYKLITKKPVIADRREIEANPRSRSAKLRIAQRQ